MAIGGIGGNGAGAGSALDKFQKLRDAAQKKLDGADRQASLAELIQQKQRQLGAGASAPVAAKSQAERIPPGPAAPGNAGAATGPSAVYGRAGTARKQDAAPRLGQYIDFTA